MDAIQNLIEGKIDFEGQKLAERVHQFALAVLTFVSFVVGLVMQDLRATFSVFGIGAALVVLVVIPPWPVFNAHPVQWLAVKDTSKKQK